MTSDEWTVGGNDRGRSPTRWAWSENGAFTHKDVKYEGRSGNVYENKGPSDNLPDTKDDICAWLDAILQKKVGILGEMAPFLSQVEHSGTNLALQNVEIGEAERHSALRQPPTPVSRLSKIADFRFRIPDSESRALRPIVNRQSKIGNSAPNP